MSWLSSGGHDKNKIRHKGGLGGEHDAQTFILLNILCAVRWNSMHTMQHCITLTRGRHVPANTWYIHAYIEIEQQCWPVQCHMVYTKYTREMENCNR